MFDSMLRWVERKGTTVRFGNLVGGFRNDSFTVTSNQINGKDTLTINVFEMIPPVQDEAYAKKVGAYLYDGDYDGELKPVLS